MEPWNLTNVETYMDIKEAIILRQEAESRIIGFIQNELNELRHNTGVRITDFKVGIARAQFVNGDTELIVEKVEIISRL